MTPTVEEIARLKRQNAQLLRALLRAKEENAALSKQLAEKQAEQVTR